jgi:hypothetical protein
MHTNTKNQETESSFIYAPSCEELKPTPEEAAHFEALLNWQKQSEKSTIILGVPLN